MLPKPPTQSKRVIALSIAILVVAVKQLLFAFHLTAELVLAIGNVADAITGLAAAAGITAYGLEYRDFVKTLLEGKELPPEPPVTP